MPTLYTIGHSNHTLAEFLKILKTHSINCIIDVRTIPKSRFVPWSTQKSLHKILKAEHIRYIHMPELGGLRHPEKDSVNLGWQNEGFRGFADYMQTKKFHSALAKLKPYITKYNTAIMCAEALPWRCHRSLIADAEVIRGTKVLHLMSPTSLKEHSITEFAEVDKKSRPFKIIYPSTQKDLFT